MTKTKWQSPLELLVGAILNFADPITDTHAIGILQRGLQDMI